MKDTLFPKFKPQNRQDLFNKLLGLLRYAIFISFYILSIRLIYISIDHATIIHPLLLALLFFGIAILSVWRTLWSLYLFLAAIPLISGLQLLGFMRPIPMPSLIFASIYLSWLPKRLFLKKEDILPRTGIGHLADILSGIVLLSLIFTLGNYPVDLILHRVWSFPTSMKDTFFSIHAAYVLLQGLFFYRIMELEINDRSKWHKLVSIFYFQVPIIAFFLVLQIIYRVPPLSLGYGFYSPLEDIHSFGSYLSLLFFAFLSAGYGESLRHKFYFVIFSGFIFLFIILSYSRATWIAVIIVGAAFLIYKLPIRRKVFPISCVALIFLSVNLFPDFLVKSRYPYIQRFGRLVVLSEMVSDSGANVRVDLWKRAVNMVSDFPITGTGVGTFYRISPLYHDLSIKEFRDYYENAHNYFLQFVSELGLPALFVFLGILFMTFQAGLAYLRRFKESAPLVKGFLFGLGAYLITCITGHPLLISNQQFLFWFFISLIVTPRTIANHYGGDREDRLSQDTSRFMVVLTMIVIAGYALEYGPGFWRMSQEERKYEYGFYSYEDVKGKKVRWTEKKAFSKTVVMGSVIDFDVYAMPHNIGSRGLNFKVFINNELWDEINFTKGQMRRLRYYIPFKKNELIGITTVVNKTFIPIRMGLNKDTRQIGVGISEMRFVDEVPTEGIGFGGVETLTGEPIPGWPKNTQAKFRWTGLRASMNIKDRFKNGVTFFLHSSHPDVANNPVRVNILSDGRLTQEVVLMDHQWKKVFLHHDLLKGSSILTFKINRTWNPKLLGLSEDYRDLGVAVAIPEE